MYSTELTKYNKKAWYILNFKDFRNPKVYANIYGYKVEAERAIKKFEPHEQKYLKIYRGSKLKMYLHWIRHKASGIMSRYDFKEGWGLKEKKTFKKRHRSRLKRMGLFFKVVRSHHITKGTNIPKVKPILVTNRKYILKKEGRNINVAFQLRRKSPQFMYLIRKIITGIGPYIFKVKVMRLNMINGKLHKRTLLIQSTDFIIPFILPEILKILNNIPYGRGKDGLDYLRERHNYPFKK